MEKRSDDLHRDVEALVRQSDKLLEYERDLMNEAARIRGEAARVRRPPLHRAESGPAEAGGRSGWPGLSVTSDLTARYHECYTFHYMASSLQPASFRLEPALLAALQAIKERDGVPVSEQVRRALQAWIETRGVVKAAPRRAATRRKA